MTFDFLFSLNLEFRRDIYVYLFFSSEFHNILIIFFFNCLSLYSFFTHAEPKVQYSRALIPVGFWNPYSPQENPQVPFLDNLQHLR